MQFFIVDTHIASDSNHEDVSKSCGSRHWLVQSVHDAEEVCDGQCDAFTRAQQLVYRAYNAHFVPTMQIKTPRRLGIGRQLGVNMCSQRGRSILDTVWDHQF
jgi:hypothetical protein